MKINIDIDDDLVKDMYRKFCDKNSCDTCPAFINIDDDELGCFNKYKNRIFESDFNKLMKGITYMLLSE